MEQEQRERLLQELRFLKESLEAGVISKEEYERGKERIDNKLKDFESQEESVLYSGESKPEEHIEIKEIAQETPKQALDESGEEEKKVALEQYDVREEQTKLLDESGYKKEAPQESVKPESKAAKKSSRKLVYGLAFLGIIAVVFFLMRGFNNHADIRDTAYLDAPACSSDADCSENGKMGICVSPNSKEARCEFIKEPLAELTIINDKKCGSCNSSRMEEIILDVFLNVKTTYLNYSAPESRGLISDLGITALPAYIFGDNITKTANFNGFQRALIKKGNVYLISNTASGSGYFFKREKMPSKLEFFLTPDMEEKVAKTLNDFSALFNGKVAIKKTIVAENDRERLSEELGITSYPSFLINNQFKFGGLQPANSIKGLFCKFNSMDECKNSP